MPKFSKASLSKLESCHQDIQSVMKESIKHMDFVVLSGYRTPNEQFELYKKGRKFEAGKWVKVGTTVTNIDGKTKLSNHNYYPSQAIDIAPYPIDWNDTDRFEALAVVVKKAAKDVGVEIEWGGDWVTPIDMPHFQLKDKK